MEVAIPPGVSRGSSPADRPGRWYETNLVRWRDGRLMPIGGTQRLTSDPLDSTVRRILPVRDNSDIKRIVLGCHDHLLVYEGDAITDVSPASFSGFDSGGTVPDGFGIGPYGEETYGTPRSVGDPSFLRAPLWSLDNWGEDVLAVASSDGRLLHFDATNPTTDVAAVVGAPIDNRAMVVTPERFVMLIGAGGDPRLVQWASQESLTDWTPTSVNTAGDLFIESEGHLVSATECRDGILVHSDSDAWIIRYQGSPFVFGREKVGDGISLMAPATIARVNGGAAWMGRNGFWLYEAGQCRPLPCEISEYVFSDIDPVHGILRSHAATNGLFQEVWWFWPSVGSEECDRYAIWNYAENWWAVGEMDATAMHPAGVHQYPLMGSSDGHLHEMENGWTDGGNPRTDLIYAETSSMSSEGSAAILRVQADGDGDNGTTFTILSRSTRDGAETTYGPYTANSDGWTPTRAGGRHLRLRMRPEADGAWSVGRPVIDITPTGRR